MSAVKKLIKKFESKIGDINDTLLMILTGKKLQERFYGNEFQKANQKEFKIEEVIKKKDDKLYVKWRGYNNSFNGLLSAGLVLIII